MSSSRSQRIRIQWRTSSADIGPCANQATQVKQIKALTLTEATQISRHGGRGHFRAERDQRLQAKNRVVEIAVARRSWKPPSSFRASAGSARPASMESPSCFGDRRATCSISSLKLTAPTLDLHLKYLAHHPAQEAFQAGIFERRQHPHRLFLCRTPLAPGSRSSANSASSTGETTCSRFQARSSMFLPSPVARSYAIASGSDGPESVAEISCRSSRI